MKKLYIYIFVLVLLILVVYSSLYFFRNYVAHGILWGAGISDIKLVHEEQRFKFYLYEVEEDSQTIVGILTLQRRNDGPFWSKYSDVRLPIYDDRFAIRAYYGNVENGRIQPNYVWGGFLKNETTDEVRIKLDEGQWVEPDHTLKEKGIIYFLHNVNDKNSEQLKIEGEIE